MEFGANELWLLGGVLLYAATAPALWVALRRLLPPAREMAVPWSGLELIVVIIIVMVLWPSLMQALVVNTPLGEAIYGEEVIQAIKDERKTEEKPQNLRVGLLSSLLAFPLQIVSVVLLLRQASGTRMHQLGLTDEAWQRNVVIGAIAFVLVTPLTLAIFNVVEMLTSTLFPGSAKEHLLQQLVKSNVLSDAELILVVVRPVIVAAILEELLFRGVLQSWLAKRSWGGDVAMGLALLCALPQKSEHWDSLLYGDDWAKRAEILMPVAFVLCMLPVFVWIRERQVTPVPSALFGVSLLFGMVHTFAWPSPVPLFVLGLSLGYLRARTQSLVGPIVLHALFNTVGCLMLLIG